MQKLLLCLHVFGNLVKGIDLDSTRHHISFEHIWLLQKFKHVVSLL